MSLENIENEVTSAALFIASADSAYVSGVYLL
jgi:hypothetical protein